MRRGSLRKVVAGRMLALCLLLAVSPAAEAQGLRLETHDPAVSLAGPQQESAFWEKIWSVLDGTWARVSVLIEPEG